jgi:CubicO group peptidase (beta-lactamase class C family)
MPRRLLIAALLLWVCLPLSTPRPASAQQDFVLLRFEQFLDSARQQAGIPGLSAIIIKDGQVAWERHFGFQDVEAGVRTSPLTAYRVAGLTQMFAATLLLQCADRGLLELDAPAISYVPDIGSESATVRHVLSNTADDVPGLVFRYDAARYAKLATAVDGCTARPYRLALATELLDRLAMVDSVPGQDLTADLAGPLSLFEEAERVRYLAILQRVAKPYRVDRNGRSTPSTYPANGLDASGGLVSTVRDLARFDQAHTEELLLSPDMLAAAWTPHVAPGGRELRQGLGWFVQPYNGERIVWQFGQYTDATSSLIIKVPGRGLTLFLLANSDGLTAPYQLEAGDVTTSLFARLFLRFFL